MVLFKSVLVLLTVTLGIISGSEIKKRGINNYGYAGISDFYTGLHPELNSKIHGFYGHKALTNPIYSRPLAVHKIGGVPYQLFRPQAGSPLGGHVTSYSVNYPRTPFYQHKHSFVPLGHHHIAHHYPVHAPLHTQFFLPQQPIYPHVHSIPAPARPVVQHIIPNVLQQRPSPVLPLPVKPIVNPSGVFQQPTFFLPQRPAVPTTKKPVFSSLFPANFFQNFHTSVQPQFIPVAVPSQPTLIVQTTQTTPTTSVGKNPTFVSIPLPIPGVNFNSGSQPEQNSWRPMGEVGINSIQRPAISLLPPYTAVANQNGIQFFNPNQLNYQNSLENQNGNSNFFSSNTESQNNNNNFNIQTNQAENENNLFNPLSSNHQNTENFEGQQQHHFTSSTGGDHDLSQGIFC